MKLKAVTDYESMKLKAATDSESMESKKITDSESMESQAATDSEHSGAGPKRWELKPLPKDKHLTTKGKLKLNDWSIDEKKIHVEIIETNEESKNQNEMEEFGLMPSITSQSIKINIYANRIY